MGIAAGDQQPRPDLAHQHEGRSKLRQLLLAQASNPKPSDPNRHLFSLLKAKSAQPLTSVAVSPRRCRIGDIYLEETTLNSDTSDRRPSSMEETPTGKQGLFLTAGLKSLANEGEQPIIDLESDVEKGKKAAEKTMGKSEVQEYEAGEHKFPPSPPKFKHPETTHKGPWWKELLASPVKRLKLGWSNVEVPPLTLPPPVAVPHDGMPAPFLPCSRRAS